MSRASILVFTLALVVVSASAWAGTTMYGLTGLIETPDDHIAQTSVFNLTGNYVSDFGDTKDSISTYGGTIGLMPKLEVGIVGLSCTPLASRRVYAVGAVGDRALLGVASTSDSTNEALLNVKFRVVDETLNRPSITVGMADISSRLEKYDERIGDPSAFVVIGRNLTNLAESFGGVVSKPLRGTIGFGSGVYKGAFAGLDWSLSEKTDLMVEYLSNGLRQDTTFNAGLRLKPISGLSVELGAMDMKDFYGGASYTISTY
jgi:hypothetical protein